MHKAQPNDHPQSGSSALDVKEVGRVASVREMISEVLGLPSCMNGQIVEFSNGDQGMVMGFTEHRVLVLSFGSKGRIRAGDEVYSRSRSFMIPVGEDAIGRVVTALGLPFDDRGPIRKDAMNPIFREPPGVMQRIPVKDALETGIRIIDASFPLAKGQRQLIIGDQMTGKTSIVTDTILNQRGKNVICIYCSIGQSRSSFLKTLRILQEHDALKYTVVVAGIASVPLGEQYLAPYSACALGEYFAAQGKDVFIAFDDLGKHAWVYRQLSLLLERPPGREAYPGDIFYTHSQLLERAGKFGPEVGGGTMTFLPIVATIQSDMTGYIQTNLISITDGQLYLNTGFFQRGIRPAIDFGLSVSRIGNRAQCEAMKKLSGKLRLEYLQFMELQRMMAMKADLSESAQARLLRGELISFLFLQKNSEPSSLVEQIIFLYAVQTKILEGKMALAARFKKDITHWLTAHHPSLIKDIESSLTLAPEWTKRLDAAFEDFIKEQSA